MFNIIFPIITLVIVALFGVLSSYIGHKQSINIKLIDQYLEIRKVIAKEIAPITNIDLLKKLTNEDLHLYRNKVSHLYHEHYDLLPIQVLEALLLLDICLGNPSYGLVIIRNGNIDEMIPLEIVNFVENLTFFRNTHAAICLSLQSNNSIIRENQAIKLHARNVLLAMSKFSSLNAMYSFKANLNRRQVI